MFALLFFPIGFTSWGVGMGLAVSQMQSAPPPPPKIYEIVALTAYADTPSFEDAPRISDTTLPAEDRANTPVPKGQVFHWPFDSLDPPRSIVFESLITDLILQRPRLIVLSEGVFVYINKKEARGSRYHFF